jgi:hypothetical protein
VTVYSYEQPATGVNQYVNRKCREPSSLRSMLRCAQPELAGSTRTVTTFGCSCQTTVNANRAPARTRHSTTRR